LEDISALQRQAIDVHLRKTMRSLYNFVRRECSDGTTVIQ